MDYELGVIEKTGFISYFFVVSDFIRHAKDEDIPVGPGRGSGAGSLVAYLTRITDIDPLRFNLFFERFLNPERVSPPDFDIDFCEKRRGEVIDYVRGRYGFDSVAQICTYGLLKPKAVVKDVARVLGHDFDFGNRLTKLIPEDPKMTLDKAVEQSKELAALIESDPDVARVFKFAKVLEGLNRQTGIHAAGVIIGDQRLDNLVPLARSASDSMVVPFPAHPCEEQGLLKMDFLGLRTLTIIKNALNMIKKNHGIDIDMMKIPLDDPKTFEMLQRGDTVAVFQLESGGMQNLCRSFGVETLEHIIALLAIYRPGPMQFIPDFIARKKGEAQIIYDHPLMEDCLKETYGIMLLSGTDHAGRAGAGRFYARRRGYPATGHRQEEGRCAGQAEGEVLQGMQGDEQHRRGARRPDLGEDQVGSPVTASTNRTRRLTASSATRPPT